jgi:hypothetical protein
MKTSPRRLLTSTTTSTVLLQSAKLPCRQLGSLDNFLRGPTPSWYSYCASRVALEKGSGNRAESHGAKLLGADHRADARKIVS